MIRGRNLKELFLHAAAGLFDLITDWNKIKTVRHPGGVKKVRLHLKAEDVGQLLMLWLRELLYIFSTRRMIFTKYIFQKLSETELMASAAAMPFDPVRHGQKYEVKAVTYHQFKIEKKKDGWQAEVILDI